MGAAVGVVASVVLGGGAGGAMGGMMGGQGAMGGSSMMPEPGRADIPLVTPPNGK